MWATRPKLGRRWLMIWVAVVAFSGCVQSNARLRKQGSEAYLSEDIVQADERFSQAVARDPTDWKSLFYLGRVRLAQARWFDAQLLLEQALELRHHDPETADILDGLAESLSKLGRVQKLHSVLAQAVEEYGTSRDYTRQGRYLHQLGNIDAAKLAYRKAAFFAEEGNVEPFVALADFYELIGDTENAITALRHAYAVKPSDSRLDRRLRRYGIVPGPTVGIKPEKAAR